MNKKELLNRFHEIAANPEKQKESYIAAGKKVVLTAPVYTPEEIVHAMGLIPMGAWGADIVLEKSKEYFPAFICSIVQSILEVGMNGGYTGASALIVPSLCDSLKCLGQNWKYAVPEISFIPMTYPQNRKCSAGFDFVKAGYERVIRDLEKITGAELKPEDLSKSIKIYNRHNAAMRELSAVLANHPEIDAAARSDIFKSAYFMEKGEHTSLVLALLDILAQEKPEQKSKIPVMTSGILADNPSLLAIFDQLNLHIVADDVAAESRQYRTDAPEDKPPLDALAEKFIQMDYCSVLYDPDKKRADFIVAAAKENNAKGVVLVLTKFCDPEEFDYVPIKKACDEAGLPILLIEVDRQMTNYEQARTALETLCDLLAS